MKRIHTTFLLIVCLIGIPLLSGCTRSFNFDYQADAMLAPSSAALQKYTIGIAKFEDKRTWVEKDNIKSESFVGRAGSWKFGLTYKDINYTPVNNIVQDILVQEFTKAGFKVRAIDMVLSKDYSQKISEISKNNSVDYILGGQLLMFEFKNDVGWANITAHRTVAINFSILKASDGQLINDQYVDEKDSKLYAMALSHSVNISNLMNETFKKAAQQIVKTTAQTIAPTKTQ